MRLADSVLALVFAAESPVTPDTLARALDAPEYAVEEALESIGRRLSSEGPLQLVRIAGGYQLATKPEFSAAVARLLEPAPLKLTRSLLEVLAIVAYQQPITLAEIDSVRGVQSDYSLRQLVEKRLVIGSVRKDAPGRPNEYRTTAQFLHMFNLNTLDDLPNLALPQGDILAIESAEDPNQPGLPFEEGH